MSELNRTITRRSFSGMLAGAGVMGGMTGSDAQEKRPEFTGPLTREKLPGKIEVSKPNGLNLIVIIADTFRWDYLGCNGNDRIRTPNLDALAAEGTYFENCYADGLPTIPARRVIHTGRSILPEETKWVPLDKNDITLAEIVSKAGFTTGFIADTFHYFKPDMNFHRGFSSWEWIRGQESDALASGPRSAVRPEDHVPAHLLNDYYRERIIQYVLNTRGRRGEEDYFCARSCRAAAKWLGDNKDNGTPFMLFVDMFDPHEPWDAPPRFQKMYRAKYPCERYLFGYGVKPEDVRPDDIPVLKDCYSAEVSFSDHCIGGLVREVKRLGLWDTTIIAFSTDHGTHLGEGGCIQKQAKFLNSCIARVPLIIRHPDPAFRGKRVSGLTGHVDYAPTFLSLLGIKANLSFDGFDMWDLVTGSKKVLREHSVTGYGNFGAVHTSQWHYLRHIWGKDPGLGPALYDLASDPKEERNVAEQHPDVIAGLNGVLSAAFKVKVG